jgi:hypothetical protein
MRTGLIGLALICVIVMFLFPAGAGPFSATHGPATAFRAKRVAFLSRLYLLVVAILTVACGSILSLCQVALVALPDSTTTRTSALLAFVCVLLC